MPNRILDAFVATHHADPAGAELRVVVRPEQITLTTEIKGRLMGPRSAYAQTVEIAYPFREVARTDHVLLRVLIPEPNFWQPKTPLLYEGPLELWQDGERVEQIRLRHGIRTVQLNPHGLRANGKPFFAQCVSVQSFTEEDARRWHAEGINLVMIPARDDSVELLALCDRFGLFVLGRIEEPHQWPRWPLACRRHPSFLGCVVAPGVQLPERDMAAGAGLLGAEIGEHGEAAEGRFEFVVAGEGRAPPQVPVIVKVNHDASGTGGGNTIGWLRQK
jgi:glycosyl hydrolase family 2